MKLLTYTMHANYIIASCSLVAYQKDDDITNVKAYLIVVWLKNKLYLQELWLLPFEARLFRVSTSIVLKFP